MIVFSPLPLYVNINIDCWTL